MSRRGICDEDDENGVGIVGASNANGRNAAADGMSETYTSVLMSIASVGVGIAITNDASRSKGDASGSETGDEA